MPKVTCEIDTDNKTAKFQVDGQDVDVTNWNVGFYEYSDCCYSMKPTQSASVSYTTKDENGKRDVTTCISFDTIPESSMAALARQLHKNIYKEIENFSSSSKLSVALSKLKK